VSITRSPRARQVGDAAITVLASQGTRGLTHRAVDAAGQLPPGSTSNYARTRIALLTLALARIAELDTAEGMEAVGGYPESVPALTEALTLALHRMLTDEAARRRLLARFELAFEATRRPELRAVYDEMGRGFREHVARLLAAAGAGGRTAAPGRSSPGWRAPPSTPWPGPAGPRFPRRVSCGSSSAS